MKFKIMACLQVVLMLFMLCVPSISMASVSTDISLLLNKTSAAVGETVTASGTAAPNAWVPLKVVDAAQNIVLFDTTKADANGNYSIDIVIPAGASGTLTVIVGEGSNVATGSLTVTGAPQAVTLNLSKTEASVGETVTASGTAAPNAWVPLKVVDAAQNIVLFDTTKADANGNYSIDIVIPAGASGTLTVIVGEGSNVATGSLTVTGAPQAVTLNLSKTEASVGETVTASGTAAPNAWVPLKVVDAAQNIVLFDTTKADANGNYSIDIVIPAGASGTLTVIAGEGSNVATKSLTVTETPPVDTEAPVWTDGSLIATDITQTTITLSWSGATDNVGVTGYKVYQDGTLLTETPVSGTSYEVTGLSAGTEYTFKVEAVDAAGNESTDGPSITVSTKMEIVAKPSAWPLGGAVVKGTEVTLKTATAGATIYYTEDGSNPTPESKAYTSPITINGPVTIKAIAVKAGMANSDIMTESYTIAEPILEPEVTIKPDGSNKELAITQDTQNLSAPVQINVPGNVTDAIISVTALMNEPDPDTGMVTTDELPALNINASTEISATAPVKVEIPAGASIEAPANWNGNINVPRVEEKTSVKVTPDPGMTATVDSVIEIGFGDVPLTFNRAVRILIPGKAGKDAGYYRGDQFFKISSLPPGALDTQEWANNNIPDGGDGKLDVGDDLVIWTKHFTKFVTYTQTKTSTGGGSSSQPVTSTTGTATVKPGVGGTISLGDEATIKVPANALTGTSAVEVKIQKVTTPPAVPAGFKLASNVYEFSVGGENSYNFARAVTITLSFDPEALNPGEKPEIYYFDEAAEQWVNIGGTVYGNTISVQLDHFTKFAVLVAGEGEQQPTFNDIAGHWAADNINQLVGLGAINGYPDGSFKPDNNITRAEFTTILVRAFQLTSKDGKTFPDTAVHWARDYIAAAADNGVVNGYDTGFFGPDDLITREQMAVMVVNAAKLPAASGELRFDDSSSISGWAREAIVTATHNGIMQGYPDNTIQPLGNATRAEAVTVIVKALTGR
ncbi:MAG: S-layer homology domain-containing protein [Peptococcaceae bacterium MAG4]|nr:S-layer homology domain-containing protein [Peptococcaceae bacterium MAG4]